MVLDRVLLPNSLTRPTRFSPACSIRPFISRLQLPMHMFIMRRPHPRSHHRDLRGCHQPSARAFLRAAMDLSLVVDIILCPRGCTPYPHSHQPHSRFPDLLSLPMSQHYLPLSQEQSYSRPYTDISSTPLPPPELFLGTSQCIEGVPHGACACCFPCGDVSNLLTEGFKNDVGGYERDVGGGVRSGSNSGKDTVQAEGNMSSSASISPGVEFYLCFCFCFCFLPPCRNSPYLFSVSLQHQHLPPLLLLTLPFSISSAQSRLCTAARGFHRLRLMHVYLGGKISVRIACPGLAEGRSIGFSKCH